MSTTLTRDHTKRITAGLAAIVAAAALTGCGAADDATEPAPQAGVSAPAEPGPVDDVGDTAAQPDLGAYAEAPAVAIKEFGQPQTTAMGSVVTIGAPTRYVTSNSALTPGVRAAKFKVTMTAPKDQPVDPTTASFSASHDGQAAEQVFDMDGLGDVWALPKLRPGKTVTFEVAFVGAASGEWDVDMDGSDRTLMWSTGGAK